MRTNRKKQGYIFIISSLAMMLTLLLVYFLTIELWLTKQNKVVPYNYKEFLLTNTPSPKIIVDSGSNSLFGIDALALEREFNMPAINIADNINYPIKHKFSYLSKYTKKGDIIILPVEWQSYQNRPYYTEYIEALVRGNTNHYYNSLSLTERIELVYKGVRVDTLLKYGFNFKPRNEEILREFKQRLMLNNANSLGSNLRPDGEHVKDRMYPKDRCKDLIDKNHIGSEFEETIKILEAVKLKGATVVFTWPVVADNKGNNCYSSKETKQKLKNSVKKITRIVQNNNMIVIGKPEDSVFPSKYYYDSFYHVTMGAATIRTKRLAEDMKEAGINPSANVYRAGDSIKHLRKKIEKLLYSQTKGGE